MEGAGRNKRLPADALGLTSGYEVVAAEHEWVKLNLSPILVIRKCQP